VNFNCAAYIPYFPAGYHHGERGNAIVFGLETPDLLAAALRRLEKQPAPHAAQMQTTETSSFPVQKIFFKIKTYKTIRPLKAACTSIFPFVFAQFAQRIFHPYARAAVCAAGNGQKQQYRKRQNQKERRILCIDFTGHQYCRRNHQA